MQQDNIDELDNPEIVREFNQLYSTWWSGKENNYYSAGVGLAIKKPLSDRVFSIKRLDGRLLMADLHLKRKINIRIIVIYMPADEADKLERKAINSKVESWIKQSVDSKKFLIILGDFNVNMDKLNQKHKIKVNTHKAYIIEIMKKANLFEVQSVKDNTVKSTWKTQRGNQQISSRIDYIWMSFELFQRLKSVEVSFDTHLDSDHGLLSTTIYSSDFIYRLSCSQESRSRYTRKIFALDKMTNEDWMNYQSYINDYIQNSSIIDRLENIPTIDRMPV